MDIIRYIYRGRSQKIITLSTSATPMPQTSSNRLRITAFIPPTRSQAVSSISGSSQEISSHPVFSPDCNSIQASQPSLPSGHWGSINLDLGTRILQPMRMLSRGIKPITCHQTRCGWISIICWTIRISPLMNNDSHWINSRKYRRNIIQCPSLMLASFSTVHHISKVQNSKSLSSRPKAPLGSRERFGLVPPPLWTSSTPTATATGRKCFRPYTAN